MPDAVVEGLKTEDTRPEPELKIKLRQNRRSTLQKKLTGNTKKPPRATAQ